MNLKLKISFQQITKVIAMGITVTLGSTVNANTNQEQSESLVKNSEMSSSVSEQESSVQIKFQELAWLDKDGQPSSQVRQVLKALSKVQDYGLNPNDYPTEKLMVAIQRAPQQANAEQLKELNDVINHVMLRLVGDLHNGQILAREMGQNLNTPTWNNFRIKKFIVNHFTSNDILEAIVQLAHRVVELKPMMEAINRYEALSKTDLWKNPLPPLKHKIKFSETWVGIRLLTQRLSWLGYLPANAQIDEQWTPELQEALKHYQKDHGLEADGQLGQITLGSLNITPEYRLQQLRANLLRMRWAPTMKERTVIVNIPEFVLRAYDVDSNGHVDSTPDIQMRVVVGQAKEHSTPLFSSYIKYLEFMPNWNVPESITDKEIIPKLVTGSKYFERNQYEIVYPDGHVVDHLNNDAMFDVALGMARIRQKSGLHNALGTIKFALPNQYGIYLHYTPSVSLFKRVRRDFSHGCIRLEQPEKLAQFVLNGQSEWTPDRIRKAMSGKEKTRAVSIKTPVAVTLLYQTAFIKEGKVHFVPDIYHRDDRLINLIKNLEKKRSQLPFDIPLSS